MIVQEFTTPHEVPTRTVFDMSIGPNYLPCSRSEYTWPRRRLADCRGIHHIRSPSCAKEELAIFADSCQSSLPILTNRKPTVHAGGIRHNARQQIMSASPAEANATATLIHLTFPLITYTEIAAAPLDFGSPSADISCTASPGHANFTAVMQEWKAHCRTATPLCGVPKGPNL